MLFRIQIQIQIGMLACSSGFKWDADSDSSGLLTLNSRKRARTANPETQCDIQIGLALNYFSTGFLEEVDSDCVDEPSKSKC